MTSRPPFRTEQTCSGLFRRIEMEVSEAARNRDLGTLAYWHARQKSMHNIYYLNGLYDVRARKGDIVRMAIGRYRCESERALSYEP